ncbi:MAG TPA: fumarylacetoacetate hydrolase family protein [Thermomicrobiales bacterium]|nr:fumarylacetoacetate hydrolase family protein [Thermomicrobiales bacterium]HRA46995.1 fumarylacetoacetate hydrolase family protein [Thermomicrobiales bacterium]
MPLCLYSDTSGSAPKLGLISGETVIDVAAAGGPASLAAALQLSAASLTNALTKVSDATTTPLSEVKLEAPIDEQEIWAAGVTYLRSRDARMEESTEKSVYDRIYDAERPEIFFKAMRNRVSGPGVPVAIRSDSAWDVPEPELALVINTAGEIVGYTIGNDVSSRTIEGENPLYLPQAKVYSKCAGLGPVIVLAHELPDPRNRMITLTIRRGGNVHFAGETSTSQIHRRFQDLVSYLRRDNEFPAGVILMTGTGIVPPSEFTLEDGDEVAIAIDGIGTLTNPVIRLG